MADCCKSLECLDFSGYKLNTLLENTLPDNIVDGLKTINLALHPYAVKLAHAVTFIKRPHFSFPGIENFYCDGNSEIIVISTHSFPFQNSGITQ
jgi:hypothetical protein